MGASGRHTWASYLMASSTAGIDLAIPLAVLFVETDASGEQCESHADDGKRARWPMWVERGGAGATGHR